MAMMALDAEVIVVGGGPAGAATATLLARQGHDVLLLDRAAFPREKPCAEYLSPGVLDVLRRLGALERIASLAVARPWGMVIHTPRARLAVTYPASDIMRPMRRALGVPRPAFDAALHNLARRPTLAATLGGLLGDYQPAAAALRPAFLAALLRP